MRGVIFILVLLAAAGAEGPREVPLLNVEIVDAHGVQTMLVGFHRISGQDYFQGYLGSGEIEVPYTRVSEIKILGPGHPGGRMRAAFTLQEARELADRAGLEVVVEPQPLFRWAMRWKRDR